MADERATAACFCDTHPHRRLYADEPARYPEMRELDVEERRARGGNVLCTVCGVVWDVAAVAGGGIYGDVEWLRVEPPSTIAPSASPRR